MNQCGSCYNFDGDDCLTRPDVEGGRCLSYAKSSAMCECGTELVEHSYTEREYGWRMVYTDTVCPKCEPIRKPVVWMPRREVQCEGL